MAKEKKDKKEKKTGIGFSLKLAFFIIIVSAGVFLPSTIVMGVLMIPTFVALLIDRSPQRSIGMTVGLVNFAGVVPAWLDLWETGHTLKKAIAISTDPKALLLAYAAAAVGWVIYTNITPFVALIVVRKTEKRVKDIDQRQKALIKRWGQEVTGALSSDGG